MLKVNVEIEREKLRCHTGGGPLPRARMHYRLGGPNA
jgi:hypothetical protein